MRELQEEVESLTAVAKAQQKQLRETSREYFDETIKRKNDDVEVPPCTPRTRMPPPNPQPRSRCRSLRR